MVKFNNLSAHQHSSSANAANRASAPAAQTASFKGTLLLLQNKTKRDPESYYEEFLAQLRHFDALSKVATTSQRLIASTSVSAAKAMKNNSNNKNEDAAESAMMTNNNGVSQAQEDAQFTAVLNYLCHVSHCYPKECAHIPDVLLNALSTTGSKMNPNTRRNFVDNLMLLRSKNLVQPEKTLPVMFDLLLVRDKSLRKAVLGHIVSDIRRFNMPASKATSNNNGRRATSKNQHLHTNNRGLAQQSNKLVQNFLFSVVAQDDPTQTRCALLVMIDLYRRGIWSNERCVEVIAQACFSKHTRIIRTALRFFMMQFPKISSLDDNKNDSDEDFDPKQVTEAMTRKMHKHKAKGKTKHRARVLKREVNKLKKKLDPSLREKAEYDRQDVDPVRLLRDPQTFTERLLSQLQKTSERFEVRLLYLTVIARIVSEHQVVVLPLYNYLERFLQPNQVHAPTILALTSTCAHPLVPPDALESLVRSIANHFVNDRSQPDAITIGINTIREICKRQPLAMSEDLLKDLAEYRTMRGERGIIMAARSLIQLYRSVDPNLLPPKLRGVDYDREESAAKKPVFGASRPLIDIPGMEMLYGDIGAEEDENNDEEQNLSGFEETLGEDDVHVVGKSKKQKKNAKKKEDDSDNDSDDNDSDDSSSMIDIDLSDSDGGGNMDDWEFCSNDDDNSEKMSDDENDDDDKKNDKVKDGDNDDDDLLDEEDDEEEMMDFDEEDLLDDDEEDDDELLDFDEEDDDEEEEESETSYVKEKRPRASGGEDDIWEESDDEEETKVRKTRLQSSKATKARKQEEDQDASTAKRKQSSSKNKRSQVDDDDDDEAIPQLVSNRVVAKQQHQQPQIIHASAATGAGWYEDTTEQQKNNNKTKNSREASTSGGFSGIPPSTASSKMSTMKILTEEDFVKLRKIQEGLDPNEWKSARGRKKEIQELKKKKLALITPGSEGQVEASAIESFTNKKRSQDKAEKIEAARELRKQRSPFELRKKRKSKLNSTHVEKSKSGKLFAMTKRSARVGAKLKMSVEDKRSRAKDMKKKNIKFRINRGWKA